MSEQPPYGEAGAPPPEQPPEPPPYGQSGASWPNSQPAPPPPTEALPPTHSIPGQPTYGQTPPSAAGLPYGAGQPPPVQAGPPGSHPYGGPGGYGGPYIPPLPQKSNAGKVVALVVGVILLLTCGGCAVFGMALYNAGQDVLDEIETYEPPTVEETVSVAPGDGFLIGNVQVESGWSVEMLGGVPVVEGMRGTAVGAVDFNAVALDLTFYRGDRIVAEGSCGGTVDESDVVELACSVTDRKARKADRVEIESVL
jgi:hypothetical protein